MARTRTLVVDASQQYVGLKKLDALLDQPAPLLRAFSYGGNPQEWGNFRLTDRKFMGGHTTSLTHLMLAHIPIHMPGLRIPTLVHLDLHHCWFDTATLMNVFDLLAAALQLERLFLTAVVLSSGTRIFKPQESPTLPRLSYLGLSGSLLVCSGFMAHLPIPMHGYIMHTDPWPESPLEKRIQALDRAFTTLGLPVCAHKTSIVPVLNLHCKGQRTPYQHCLLIERPGEPGGITYEDHCKDLDGFADILNQARALRVHGRGAFEPLFIYATRPNNQDQVLGALEHLVLEDFDSQLYFFSQWLARRARAGRPLKSVNFCGKQSYVIHFGTVAELGRQMVKEGVVEQVLINGQPLAA